MTGPGTVSEDSSQAAAGGCTALPEAGSETSLEALRRENERLARDLHEARETHAATVDVLKAISGTPLDLVDVLTTVVETAGRLCRADLARIFLPQDDGLVLAASRRSDRALVDAFVHQKLARDTVTGRAAIERRTVQILDVLEDPDYLNKDAARVEGLRTVLAVPLIREDRLIGVMSLNRLRREAYTPREIDLVSVFADQAVIAIENARLVQELKASLAYQTATGDVLKVISRSTFNLDSVLATLVETAMRLCNATGSRLFRPEGDTLVVLASRGHDPKFEPMFSGRKIDRALVVGRAALERRVVHVVDVLADPEYAVGEEALVANVRTVLAVPMLREGEFVGIFSLVRARVEAFSQREIDLVTVFADQAVIAIENARLVQELQARGTKLSKSVADLSDALEFQTATSDVLKAISGSTFDLESALTILIEAAGHLCRSDLARILRPRDGGLMLAASRRSDPAMISAFVHQKLARDTVSGRAALERRLVHVVDVLEDPEFLDKEAARAEGLRTVLSVPLLRDDRLIGVMSLSRARREPYTQREIDLLTIFADQAVVAIENARLVQDLQTRSTELAQSVGELRSALEIQTATGDVLKAISRSAFDLDAVLDTLLATAMRLCNAETARVSRLQGDVLVQLASREMNPEWGRRLRQLPLDHSTVMGRAALARVAVQVLDIQTDPDFGLRDGAAAAGVHTVLAVPLLRDGDLIGLISLARTRIAAFSPKEIELVSVFADQAVIAIENARLVGELKERRDELSRSVGELREALDFQTATSDVLKVISSSTFNLDAVLMTLVETAGRLCNSDFVRIYRPEDAALVLAASRRSDRVRTEIWTRLPLDPGTASGRAALDRRVVHLHDVLEDPDYLEKETARTAGIHTVLAVPLLRDGRLIGVMSLNRVHTQPYSQREIDLVTVFADQAVIAIENARLVQELRDSLAYQTATSDVLKVISRSAFDLDTVLSTLIETAMRLCNANGAAMFRLEGDTLVSTHRTNPDFEQLRIRRTVDRSSSIGRAAIDRRVVHVADILADPEIAEDVKQDMRMLGFRTVIAMPLLRENELIGVIGLNRNKVSAFSTREIDLITVFADQAVIAIENARLVQELRESLEYQTATSDVLKVISRSAFDLDAVLTTLAETASRLCGAPMAHIHRRDGEVFRLAATTQQYEPRLEAGLRDKGLTVGRGSIVGRVAMERQAVQILDLMTDKDYALKELAEAAGARTVLGVPLMREGNLIGVISVTRTRVEAFSQREIDLVNVFADQAVIAVENARLVQELRESLQFQTATSDVLKVISRSAFDLETVLSTLVETAARLCNADRARIFRREGDVFRSVAITGDWDARDFPAVPVDRGSVVGRVAMARGAVHLLDACDDPEAYPELIEQRRASNTRTMLGVPLMREGSLIGTINLVRTRVEAFTPREIDLVTVFADQAVIAIENARLLQEIRARTAELAQSVEELRALGETGQTVVSTLDLGQVLDTVMEGAVELGRAAAGSFFRYTRATDEFSLWRARGLPETYAQTLRAMRIPATQTVMGQAIRDGVSRSAEIDAVPLLPLREATQAAGFGYVLIVPLIRGERAFGAMVLYYRKAEDVPPRAHDLMQAFASQSVVAIQNSRLYREIAEQSRQLEIASQHKSQFLANMSHELRTPMNAILGYTELLLDGLFGELNADTKDTLERVQQNGKHLLSLINDVLDLAKIEAGRLELVHGEFTVEAIVQAVMSTAQPLAEAKGIALMSEVAPELPTCHGDERRLTQVLLNLASNAVKFTDRGSVRIGAARRGDSIELSVADTGPGIAPVDQERIFGEFQQADNSITREKGGTGLGLAISRRIVEMHGGTLTVESQPGQGATFRAIFPIQADVGEAAA